MNPACSAEKPRSVVRYRTRKDSTIEPARLTSCETATTHTGRGRCRRSFQYFSMGAGVCTGSGGLGLSEALQQPCRREREQGERSHESQDVEEYRQETR